MPELMIKVGVGANYEDGDILCAFNKRRIRCTHAEHVCWPRVNGSKVGGPLGNSQPLLAKFLQKIYQYKFEQVSKTEIERTNQKTHVMDILSDTRNAQGEHIHVGEFLARRREAGKLPLFGAESAYVWYGGRSDMSATNMASIWTMIQTDSPHREQLDCPACSLDHTLWPCGQGDLMHHLVVPAVEFSDVEAEALVAPWLDETDPENPVTLKKRNIKANWRTAAVLDRLAVTEADVDDRRKLIDKRRGITPLSDVLLLQNKRAQRPGRRLI